MTLDELCRRHRRVAVDTNVFVYLFEDTGAMGRAAAALVDAISSGRITGITSSLTLTEAIVGPVASDEETTAERYVDAVRSVEHLHVVPATVEIAADAGFIRGRTGMTLADSIHFATARTAGASVLVTNDRRLRSTPQLAVVQLADLIA
jgi:predicted nucleic acid-binding protein